ncbi:hypothetical protein D3C86_1510590 [compost metagenome]
MRTTSTGVRHSPQAPLQLDPRTTLPNDKLLQRPRPSRRSGFAIPRHGLLCRFGLRPRAGSAEVFADVIRDSFSAPCRLQILLQQPASLQAETALDLTLSSWLGCGEAVLLEPGLQLARGTGARGIAPHGCCGRDRRIQGIGLHDLVSPVPRRR